MILAYLKDSLHWVHLFCFKPLTFHRESGKLTLSNSLLTFLNISLWIWLGGLVFLCISGVTYEIAGNNFRWQLAIHRFIFGGVPVGMLIGMVFLMNPPLRSLAPYVLEGSSAPLWAGLVYGLWSSLIAGLFIGLESGLNNEWLTELDKNVWALFESKGLSLPPFYPMPVTTVAIISLTLVLLRPYYSWPFYLLKLWRARRNCNWLESFRYSPVHWDETIGAPLPWLSDWLFEIAKADRGSGLAEILWVAAERPFQRNAAQKALLKLAVYELTRFCSASELSRVNEALDFLPIIDGSISINKETSTISLKRTTFAPPDLLQARLYLKEVAELATDYLKRQTPVGQHKALLELQQAVERFAKAMALAPTGQELQRVATHWLQFINTSVVELRTRLPMENPFKVGNALLEYEAELFKGRHDLVVKLEEAIFTNRPSLLLYGRRRSGKTSTLLNLPRLMSSQFVPVFIDCQNARWSDSDAMFCYHLTRALYAELEKRKLAEGLAEPQKSEFEQHAFTRLDEFLDELEAHSRRINKQILLTFDEYERLEEGIRDGKLTRAVLNQIRAIVQHRERLIVLFSGSHRFEELQTVNWSDYLINVQTLHLSFLARDEARELIEHPTPEFALGYAPGVVDRVLDLTHGQPYLVQALGSELVNLINRDKRKEATLADLEMAIDRVLVVTQAYFENNWRDCNEQEQTLLCSLATRQADDLTLAERQKALLSLSRKELVEQHDGQWQFMVELFSLWIKREKTAK